MANSTVSTVPAVKSALVAMLKARPNLAGVQISYSSLGMAAAAKRIFLDPPDVEERGQSKVPTAKAGRKARQETYTVTVLFEVVQEDGTFETPDVTEAAVYTLFAELDGGLADDETLGGAAGTTGCVTLGDHARHLAPAGKGWVARIAATVNVAARLA